MCDDYCSCCAMSIYLLNLLLDMIKLTLSFPSVAQHVPKKS